MLENAKMDFNIAPRSASLTMHVCKGGLGGYLIGATKFSFGKIYGVILGSSTLRGEHPKHPSETVSHGSLHPASRSNSGPPRSGGKGAVFANFCRAAFVTRLNWASFADDFYVLCNLDGDLKSRKSQELCICEYEY